MKKILILSILFLNYLSFGQELPQVVPLSPEASAIFKFNETPVSLFSGTQNTSIPLLEINTGGLSIPISLSYFSRGVQVSEVASRVGTGWTLNYGGMISRQIRGIADEKTAGYFSLGHSLPNYYFNPELRGYNASFAGGITENFDLGFDYYPDKYMLNSNFYSGEFYFDQNSPQSQTILTQKFSDIKILPQYDNGIIVSFQVTDDYGNKYFFGGLNGAGSEFNNENERTLNSYTFSQNGFNSTNGSSNTVTYSSWFLSKIITHTNQVIDFIYENETTEYYRRNGDTEQYTEEAATGAGFSLSSITHPVTCHFSKIQSYQKILKEINFKEGKIKFIKSENTRLDLYGGHTLDKIELYDIKNQLIKNITFNYSYTTVPDNNIDNNNINNNVILPNDLYAKKRLFLDAIDFKNASSTEKRYQFEYDSQILPSRHSNSIDFWGYYNGKNRGRFINHSDPSTLNATVDPVKIQAGLLKKITYPTGGSSVFEYEPNVLNNELPDDVKIPNPNQSIEQPQILSTISNLNYNSSTGRYEKTFTASNSIGNQATATVLLSNSSNFVCQLKNNTTLQTTFLNEGVNSYSVIQNNNSYTLIVDPVDPNWNPNPSPSNTFLMDNSFSVSLSYMASEYNYNEVVFGPGNRIKKITNYSADDVEEFSRVYEYKNDNNTTSGYLLSVANFKTHHPAYPPNSSSSNVYFCTPSISGGLFNSFTKDEFGYTQVNEYFVDKANNINEKTAHYYSLIPDFGSYYKFPLHPVTDNEWLRGKELQTILFKKENNGYKPVKKVENEYLLFGTKPIFYPTYPFLSIEQQYMPSGMEVEYLKPYCENFTFFPYLRNRTSFVYPVSTGAPYYSLNYSGCGNQASQESTLVNNHYYISGYKTTSFLGGTFDLKKSTVTDYFDNDTSLKTITTYDYDYEHHYYTAISSTTNSLGDTTETKYFYPNDPEMATKPAVNALKNKNMVGMPLVTQTFKNNQKLTEQETVYKDWDTNGLLLPEVIKTAKGNNPLEVRIRYNKVDLTNGNPQEVQQENGTKICYIWGYNKTQPVAKIENMAYASIPANLITDIENATASTATNLGSPEDVVLNKLNALRNAPALANAMVTTYTYKPLIGVSTITDPKGDTITYHYDGFNRLEKVTDKQGNILSENEYHYRTQN